MTSALRKKWRAGPRSASSQSEVSLQRCHSTVFTYISWPHFLHVTWRNRFCVGLFLPLFFRSLGKSGYCGMKHSQHNSLEEFALFSWFFFSILPTTTPHSLCCLNPGSWIYTPHPWFFKVMRTWTWDPTSPLGALSSCLCFLFTMYFEHLILS